MFRERKAPDPIRRGDIYYADLEPVVGSEQGGKRPVVVLQNNTGNRHSPTVIVAATTSKTDKPRLPTHIFVEKCESGLHHNTLILLEQIRTIDRSRINAYIGRLNNYAMLRIDRALAIGVGLDYLTERGERYATGKQYGSEDRNKSCVLL